MKKLCSIGCRISGPDKKALEAYLLTSPKVWAQGAINGMINKAIKTILKDWIETYKAKQPDSVSADIKVIIPGILAMDEFKPYNYQIPETPLVDRKEAVSEEIWEGGFDVEDHEELALRAFYSDPEAMLNYFMENKIYQRRKAFVKQHETTMLADKSVTSLPEKQDDFINLVCAKADYKNRADLEAEEQVVALK